MRARYEFKVGPINRHYEYAQPVTVIADSYYEAQAKALTLSGWGSNGKTWFVKVEELPQTAKADEA